MIALLPITAEWLALTLWGDDMQQRAAFAFVRAHMTLFGSKLFRGREHLAIEARRVTGFRAYAAKKGIEVIEP